MPTPSFFKDTKATYMVCGCGTHYTQFRVGHSIRRINRPFSTISELDGTLCTEISVVDFKKSLDDTMESLTLPTYKMYEQVGKLTDSIFGTTIPGVHSN